MKIIYICVIYCILFVVCTKRIIKLKSSIFVPSEDILTMRHRGSALRLGKAKLTKFLFSHWTLVGIHYVITAKILGYVAKLTASLIATTISVLRRAGIGACRGRCVLAVIYSCLPLQSKDFIIVIWLSKPKVVEHIAEYFFTF